jgi:hypothetical protein
MSSRSLIANVRSRVEWVNDEPGTLLVLVILLSFLAFAPGGIFWISPATSTEAAPAAHGE